MRKSCIFIAFTMLLGPLTAKPMGSLMMTNSEVNNILSLRPTLQVDQLNAMNVPPHKHPECRGIMYISATQWQVWLDNDLITPTSVHSKYKVIRVTANSVCYESSEGTYHATLSPHMINDTAIIKSPAGYLVQRVP